MKTTFRAIIKDDKKWIKEKASEIWGSHKVISKGIQYNLLKHSGIIAETESGPCGFLIYNQSGPDCEIIALRTLYEGKGIGTGLVGEMKNYALYLGCKKIIVITTNDNLTALRFYQKRGFYLTHLYADSIKKSRELKPQIPLLAENGIPIRDEIELEMKI